MYDTQSGGVDMACSRASVNLSNSQLSP